MCPTSQRPGLMDRRARLRWHRLRQSGLRGLWLFTVQLRERGPLRPWDWQWLFTVRLRQRGLLWRLRTCHVCVSRCCEAGLRRTAGDLQRSCSCVRSKAGCSGSAESSLPASLAKGLVSGLSGCHQHAPIPAARYAPSTSSLKQANTTCLSPARRWTVAPTAATFWKPRERVTGFRTAIGDIGRRTDEVTGRITIPTRNQERSPPPSATIFDRPATTFSTAVNTFRIGPNEKPL